MTTLTSQRPGPTPRTSRLTSRSRKRSHKQTSFRCAEFAPRAGVTKGWLSQAYHYSDLFPVRCGPVPSFKFTSYSVRYIIGWPSTRPELSPDSCPIYTPMHATTGSNDSNHATIHNLVPVPAQYHTSLSFPSAVPWTQLTLLTPTRLDLTRLDSIGPDREHTTNRSRPDPNGHHKPRVGHELIPATGRTGP